MEKGIIEGGALIWHSNDCDIAVKDMTVRHINNCINMLGRFIDETDPLGEVEAFWLDAFRAELKKRNEDLHFDNCGMLKNDINCKEELQLNPDDEGIAMNLSASVFLVSDDVVAASVIFEGDKTVKKYTYKTTDKTLKEGDIVIVQVHENYKVGKIVDLDAEIQFNSTRNYKWIVQKLDLTAHEQVLAAEEEMIEKVRKIDRKARREKLRQEWVEHTADEIKQISFDPTSVIDVEATDTDEKEVV